MRRYPENLGKILSDMIHDKSIKPIFWVITYAYLLFAAYIIFFVNDGSGRQRGLILVLLIPYFIFAMVYMFFVTNKKNK